MQANQLERSALRREELKLQGMVYLPEEIPQFRSEVRELQKCKDIGHLYLSNYKLHFQPNCIKDPKNATYYCVPYGFIYRVIENPNEAKNVGVITIYCKDERIFKFKFETNFQVFRDALKIITSNSLITNHELLYCHKAATHLTENKAKQSTQTSNSSVMPFEFNLIDHANIQTVVLEEFERLGISNNSQRFAKHESINPQDRLPEITYTTCIEPQKIRREIEIRKLGRIPTVVYVHGQTSYNRVEGCAIWRSAEPKNDIMILPCDEDKEFIQLMRQVQVVDQDSLPHPNKRLHIFTARAEPLS